MNTPERAREQRLVFGENADAYDAHRPSYPDAVFDAVVEFGALRPGDTAVEIGAGTGKATSGFRARGLDVLALEPDPAMAAIARRQGVTVTESLFEAWTPPRAGVRLVYAAQAWHWVQGADRYQRAANALAPGGTLALFWNKGREWTGDLGAANDAAYAKHAPHMTSSTGWTLDWVADEIAACPALEPPAVRTITWTCTYTTAEWVALLGTHSDHRILPERQRVELHDAVGDVVDRFGGRVDVVYDVNLFLSRRS